MTESAITHALPFMRFCLAFVIVFLLPGWALLNFFLKRDRFSPFEILPLSFGFSVVLLSTLAVVFYLLKLDVSAVMIALPVLIVALVALNIVGWAKRASLERAPETRAGYSLRFNVGVYALLLMAFILMLHAGAIFTCDSDSIDHVGTVREIVETRQIFPTNAFYTGDEGSGPDPRKGLFHTFLAVVTMAAGIEPYRMWLWLPALMMPLLLCAHFLFARELFQNRGMALLSALLFFLFYGEARLAGYPQNAALALYFVALFFAFRYVRGGGTRSLVGCAVVGYAVATVHIYYFFQLGLALGAFMVFAALMRAKDLGLAKKVFKAMAAILLVSAPFLYLKYHLCYAIENPYDQQARHLLLLTDRLFVVNPADSLRYLGPAGILAFILTPALLRRARRDEGALFLFATMVAAPAIIFNPLAVPLLGKVITIGLVRRIIHLAPFVPVLAFFTYGAFADLRQRGRLAARAGAIVLLALMGLLTVFDVSGQVRRLSPRFLEAERRGTPFAWIHALEFLEERIAAPSVVLSDPWTSYSIPAFTKHYVVAVPIGHSSPRDQKNMDKVADAMRVLNRYVGIEETVSILVRHSARYVVVNEKLCSAAFQYRPIDHRRGEVPCRRKFEAHPELFSRIYEEGDVFVYEFHAPPSLAGLQSDEPPLRPFLTKGEPEPRLPVGAVFDGRFKLLGVSFNKPAAERGKAIAMTCYWECLKEDFTLRQYRVFVRFDTEYEHCFMYSRRWSKLYRRVLEAINRERYRFRESHVPVDGFYPPYMWRVGDVIADTFVASIPEKVRPGAYDVKIKLMDVPFGPNYTLSDFFSDDDIYDGVRVGSILIGETTSAGN